MLVGRMEGLSRPPRGRESVIRHPCRKRFPVRTLGLFQGGGSHPPGWRCTTTQPYNATAPAGPRTSRSSAWRSGGGRGRPAPPTSQVRERHTRPPSRTASASHLPCPSATRRQTERGRTVQLVAPEHNLTAKLLTHSTALVSQPLVANQPCTARSPQVMPDGLTAIAPPRLCLPTFCIMACQDEVHIQ